LIQHKDIITVDVREFWYGRLKTAKMLP